MYTILYKIGKDFVCMCVTVLAPFPLFRALARSGRTNPRLLHTFPYAHTSSPPRDSTPSTPFESQQVRFILRLASTNLDIVSIIDCLHRTKLAPSRGTSTHQAFYPLKTLHLLRSSSNIYISLVLHVLIVSYLSHKRSTMPNK